MPQGEESEFGENIISTESSTPEASPVTNEPTSPSTDAEGVIMDVNEKEFLSMLRLGGDTDKALRIRDNLELSEEFFASLEVRSAVEKTFLYSIEKNDFNMALRIHNTFPLTEEFLASPEVRPFVEKAFLSFLQREDLDKALRIHNTLPLREEFLTSSEIRYVIEKKFLFLLENDYLDMALRIRDTFALPEEIVRSAVEKAFLSFLKWSDFDMALRIRDAFALPEEIFLSVLQEFITERNFPLGIESTLAILEGDRFGKNLLSHWPQFDTIAKKAITEVLTADDTTDPSIDRRGIEYRLLAQERLKDFGNNSALITRLGEGGIDTVSWLEYPNTAYFDLGEADQLSLGEQIVQPIKRLPESIAGYTQAIIGAVDAYKKELVEKTIPEDTTAIREQADSLVEQIAQTSDEKKRGGMERGLASLRARLENPRQLRVWDKLHAEVDKLAKIALETTRINDELIVLEAKKVAVTDDLAMQEAQKEKSLKWEKRKTLSTHINMLKHRLDKLFEVYQETLTSAIGEERATGVMSQIKDETREQQDHLQTDLTTIFSFLDDQPQEVPPVDGEMVMDDDIYKFNPKTAKLLSGRPMSVRIGSRSRHDLYIGNNTTCCIRIDSNNHGSESPIADYVTDLGMQNVLICDEVTKTPIACAWCWIGQDPKTGERALVVDNVEGWQAYTVNFRTQLEEKLREYLEAYAHTLGIPLSQGPDYNDLDVLPTKQQVERFRKLGGYNRADGYYLEAEVDG